MSRSRRHLILFGLNGLALFAGLLVLPYSDASERISVASAWICMGLLTAALLIGPLRRARGEAAPANIYLRRDLAVWSALQGFVHFYAGSVVSMNQVYIQAFVHTELPPWSVEVRDQMFSWGASLGFLAGLIYLVLLVISSDRAIRLFNPGRWKKVQKSAHLLLWLTVIHGLVFQLLEARYVPLVLLLLVTVGIFILQYRGRRKAG